MSGIGIDALLDAVGPGAVVEGDRARTVMRPLPIDRAAADAVVFCSREGDRARQLIGGTAARIVICAHDLAVPAEIRGERTLIRVEDPRLAFARVVRRWFAPGRPAPGVHPTAVIDPTATIGAEVTIGPYCVVGARAEVGAGSVLESHVVLYHDVRVGRRCVIDAGAVLGADGFGFQRDGDGAVEKFESLGGVRIGDEVEIGAHSCIDRGTLADTEVGDRTKIDNLVHIGHNVRVGADVLIPAGVVLGGSVAVGAASWIGVGSTVIQSISIGARSFIGGGSLVTKDVPEGGAVAGNPARALRPAPGAGS